MADSNPIEAAPPLPLPERDVCSCGFWAGPGLGEPAFYA